MCILCIGNVFHGAWWGIWVQTWMWSCEGLAVPAGFTLNKFKSQIGGWASKSWTGDTHCEEHIYDPHLFRWSMAFFPMSRFHPTDWHSSWHCPIHRWVLFCLTLSYHCIIKCPLDWWIHYVLVTLDSGTKYQNIRVIFVNFQYIFLFLIVLDLGPDIQWSLAIITWPCLNRNYNEDFSSLSDDQHLLSSDICFGKVP